MTSGNGVPAASDRDEGTPVRDDRQLRDIQDLIAKLADVNKKLALPIRAIAVETQPEAEPADASST